MARHRERLRLAAEDPIKAFGHGRALLKGLLYKLWFRLLGKRFRAGSNLMVFGEILLRGPGEVTLGDNVIIYGRMTPWTYQPKAKISIGDNVVIDGVRFGCMDSISIGRDCLLAEIHILDTDFHSTSADRRFNKAAPIRTAPVTVEQNVWVASGAALLPGTHVGENSVVGYGAICVRRYPPNVIIFGNPAKVVAPVSLGTLEEKQSALSALTTS